MGEAVAAVPADPAHAKPHVAHDHDRQLIVATDPDHQLTRNHAQSRVPNPSEKKEANKLVLFFVLFAKSVFWHHLVAFPIQVRRKKPTNLFYFLYCSPKVFFVIILS